MAAFVVVICGCEGGGGASLDLDFGGSSISGTTISAEAPLDVTISAF